MVAFVEQMKQTAIDRFTWRHNSTTKGSQGLLDSCLRRVTCTFSALYHSVQEVSKGQSNVHVESDY
jgi:hypothetical protein